MKRSSYIALARQSGLKAIHEISHQSHEPTPLPERKGGRPRGKRDVASRQTLYLDKARHSALAAIAEERGRSIHSLVLEGIDLIIGKPNRSGRSAPK